MEYKVCWIFGLLFFLVELAWAQDSVPTDSLQTDLAQYQYMRQRLKDKFVRVGEDMGCSLPAKTCNTEFDEWANVPSFSAGSKGMIAWGDATIYLGQYIAVLASEYQLYQDADLETDETVKELYYALSAFNRLDSLAEFNLFGVDDPKYKRNGFFIRDDVSPDFVRKNFRRSTFYSDYTDERDQWNAMSQDQVVGLLLGMACVSELLDDDVFYKGMDLKKEARDIADRMVGYMRYCRWLIKDPIKEKNVARGHSALYQSYAFAQSGEAITGKKYHDFWSKRVSKWIWKFAQYPFQKASKIGFYNKARDEHIRPVYTDVNNALMLSLAAIGDSWKRERIIVNSLAANMEVFILLNAVLYDYMPPLSPQVFLKMIHELPKEGPHYFRQEKKAAGGWAAVGRWSHPDRRFSGSEKSFKNKGEFTGLDFMLLHNLYHLAYNVPLVKKNK